MESFAGQDPSDEDNRFEIEWVGNGGDPELQDLILATVMGVLTQSEYFNKKLNQELFLATQALGEYCLSENIADVVFVDRSARPAWVALSQYLDLAHANEPKPDMHFINPHHLSTPYLPNNLWRRLREGQLSRRASRELVATKNSLLDHKDAPVLLFDACMHTGETMSDAKRVLQRAGMNDIRTGVFVADFVSGVDESVQPDFYYSDDAMPLGCRPFGRDDSLSSSGSIYAEVSHSLAGASNRNHLRRAIREVIKSQYVDQQAS